MNVKKGVTRESNNYVPQQNDKRLAQNYNDSQVVSIRTWCGSDLEYET